MANKKLIIETEVKTGGIDEAKQKLGELKKLSSGVSIQYDINGKPLDAVIDKSLNLKKQVVELTKALRSVKEGSAEFKILSSALGDAQDKLAASNAKSKDLLGSLQLLPGPVGEFASKLNGGIGLLKLFSSFSLKDLRFQLKETANDFKDIFKNISGLNDATAQSTNTLNTNATASAAAAGATKNLSKEVSIYNQNSDDLMAKNNIQIREFPKMVNGVETLTYAVRSADGSYRQLTEAEILNIKSGKALSLTQEGQIVTTNQLSFATKALTVSLNLLKLAVGGLILAGIITGISKLIELVGEWATGAKAAAAENERLTASFNLLKKSIGETQDAIKAQTDLAVLEAKIAGKTEEQIYQIIKDGFDKRVQANKDGRKKLEQETLKLLANTKLTEEDRKNKIKDIEAEIVKNGEQANDLLIEGKKIALEEELRIANKKREKTKEVSQKIIDDTKEANALLLKLQQENAVNQLDTERKRQDKQLEIDKKNEEAAINKLFQIEGQKTKLTKEQEEIKGKLLEQIRIKYGLKVIDLNKKRQEEDNKIFDEDQKKLKDYQDKIFEIMNAADENELNRAKAARTKKFEDDKAALQADANFQKQSLEEKIRILLLLEKGYRQDVQKLEDDDAAKNRENAIKKLDDELKFLQIRGEAVRKGTVAYFNNLRDISKKAEQRELADLADKAIKEKMTAEQVEAEKTAIKKKYAKERQDIDKQELEQYLAYATATLSAVSNVFSQIGQVNALQQQVASERATKAYIEQNELDKKTITNATELEKKLAENKKKFAKEEDDLKKQAFEQNKKIQIAQAIIGTLQGAIQAYQSLAVIPIVGPVLGAAAAAAALVFGYKQVNLIKKTSYQSPLALSESETVPETTQKSMTNYGRNYEKGGMIGGRRHAEGGTIIEAEKGEAIMTRGAVATFGPLLSLMNQAGGGTSFNSNLLTTRQDAPVVNVPAQQQQTPIFKTYVVSQELTTEAQRQARLKNLSVI